MIGHEGNKVDIPDDPEELRKLSQINWQESRQSLTCTCKHKYYPWHAKNGVCHAKRTNGQTCICTDFIPAATSPKRYLVDTYPDF